MHQIEETQEDKQSQRLDHRQESSDNESRIGQAKTMDELERRLSLERMVSFVSALFIGVSQNNLDENVHQALAIIGNTLNVDRTYVFLVNRDDPESISNQYEWCAAGIESQKQKLQNLRFGSMPWWENEIKHKKIMLINNVEDLPEEAQKEKQMLISQSIQSLMVVSIKVRDWFYGFIGFDSVQKAKNWDKADVYVLCTLAQIFAAGLQTIDHQEEIRRNDALFKDMFQKHSAVMLLINPQTGVIVDSNEAAQKYYGYEKQILAGMNITQINTLNLRQIQHEMDQAKKEKRKVFYFSHRRADGCVRNVEVHSTPIEYLGKNLLFSIVYDITDQINAAHDKQLLIEQWQSLLDHSPNPISVYTAQGKYIQVSQKVTQLLGKTREEICGKTFHQLFDPKVADIFQARIDIVSKSGQPLIVDDILNIATINNVNKVNIADQDEDNKKENNNERNALNDSNKLNGNVDPDIKYFKTVIFPLGGVQNLLAGISTEVTDLLIQRQNNNRLKKSLYKILNKAPLGILGLDQTGKILLVNEQIENILQQNTDFVKHKSVLDVFDSQSDKWNKKLFHKNVSGKRRSEASSSMSRAQEFFLTQKEKITIEPGKHNQSEQYIQGFLVPLGYADIDFSFVLFVQDVSLEYKLEQKQFLLQNKINDISQYMRDLQNLLSETHRFEQSELRPDKDLHSDDMILIQYLQMGYNNRQIAQRMDLAEITIKKRFSALYKKLKIKNKYELLDYIQKNGLSKGC